MGELTQQDRYEKGLNFFGAITRSLSHELHNVVAIITELTGLMEDLMYAAEQGSPLDPGKLTNTIERIGKQLQRGRGYIKQFNRLGHTVDDPRSGMDAGDMLERVVEYARRFATLKKMTMEGRRPPGKVMLDGSPYDLQHVLYRCLDASLSASGQGAALSIELEPADGGARFTIAGQEAVDAGDEGADRLSLASQLVAHMGGELRADAEPGKPLRLVVSLPDKLRLLSSMAEEPI